ncbi:hypothetical protein [uncultured Phenylobacterium sp.]|uniref:hypothetical protein n=1 Tax=uncultured Phenylobacterium sp. TaxID=349273 RepID=UPI0025D24244|nr:hypothetical protein [uncultured Phenylobacterium sp.]
MTEKRRGLGQQLVEARREAAERKREVAATAPPQVEPEFALTAPRVDLGDPKVIVTVATPVEGGSEHVVTTNVGVQPQSGSSRYRTP